MINNTRYTTINTDAGIKGRIAAYAYWIRSEAHIVRHSDRFKDKPYDNHFAEMAAIINALDYVRRDEYLLKANVIVVNCDNLHAINAFKRGVFTGNYKPIGITYKKVKAKIGSTPIVFKHVQGHKKKRDKDYSSKHYVNNWCDKEIRKYYI